MTLQHTVKAVIRKGDTHYVAECLEAPVVTQGKTLDERGSHAKLRRTGPTGNRESLTVPRHRELDAGTL